MGITNFSVSLLDKVIKAYRPITVIELGSQNLYLSSDPNPPFASEWYRKNGFEEYDCIDLAGDNDALDFDLAYYIDERFHKYDLVTDFGTSEHVVQMDGFTTAEFHEGHIHSVYPIDVKDVEAGFYYCWLNKFNLCKKGGIIISENPKSGHWPDHGYHYITKDFYEKLSDITDLEIVELGEFPAAGNYETVMNIYSILKKVGENFTALENFWSLPIYKS